jgi:Leucyl aminopeptidase
VAGFEDADINNAPSGGFAGSITCALFLQRFVTEQKLAACRYLRLDASAKPARPKAANARPRARSTNLLSERYG